MHDMEGEERPRKMAKLGHEELQEEPQSTVTETKDEIEHADAHKTTDDDHVADDVERTASNDDEEAAGSDSNETPVGEENTDGVPKMSKRQMKKLQRQQKWEAGKDDRKAKRKEKIVARRERKREELKEAKLQGKEETKEARKALESTAQRLLRSTLVPITIVLDCGFDELMEDKERVSLAQQITRCYSSNTKNPYRSHLVVSEFNKLLKERFDTVMAKSHENWKGVRTMPEDFAHAAELAKEWMADPTGGRLSGVFADRTDAKPEDGEIIYLSSDSPDTLTELKPYSTYIIGGLVDKNRYKGICYNRAVEKGIKTAKLPIGEYIQMASRSVLTTNHVVEIMLRWLDVGDWGTAFMEVIPQRKGGVLKTQTKNAGDQVKQDEVEAVVEDEDDDEEEENAVEAADATPAQ